MKRARSGFVLLTSLSLGAAAQDFDKKDPIDVAEQKCLDTGINMLGCVAASGEAWDAELNKYYRLILKTAKPRQKKALVEAQRAWLRWRKAESELYDQVNRPEGTAEQLARSNSWVQETRRRAIELKAYHQTFRDNKE